MKTLPRNAKRRPQTPPQNHLTGQLRAARETKGLTLDELAKRAGLTRGYLSLVERGLKTPSIAALLRISDVLGVGIGTLFEGNGQKAPRYAVSRARNPGGAADAATIVPLALGPGRRAMEPFLLRPSKKWAQHPYTHRGEEMIYVVSGEIEVKLEGQSVRLAAGDCLYFDGETGHELRSVGDTLAETLIVVSATKGEG